MSVEYPKPIRLLCVDDDQSYVQLLCAAVSQELDIQSFGTVSTLGSLKDAVSRYCPDVVLVDAELAGHDADEVIRTTVRDCPNSRVVVMSRKTNQEAIDSAIKAGAWGYVHKSEEPRDVVDAIRRVVRDEMVIKKPGE